MANDASNAVAATTGRARRTVERRRRRTPTRIAKPRLEEKPTDRVIRGLVCVACRHDHRMNDGSEVGRPEVGAFGLVGGTIFGGPPGPGGISGRHHHPRRKHDRSARRWSVHRRRRAVLQVDVTEPDDREDRSATLRFGNRIGARFEVGRSPVPRRRRRRRSPGYRDPAGRSPSRRGCPRPPGRSPGS